MFKNQISNRVYKDKRVLAIITARGGSKGVPRKNIKDLAGKPLIAYTIEAVKASQYLTRCIVSTDDQEIADVSRRFGADIPFVRPAELAQDDSTSVDVVRHAVQWLRDNKGENYDYVMILQPTSPLRTADDIDACIKKIVDTGADSVMAMKELVDYSLKKLKKIIDDKILPYAEDEGKAPSPRHKLEKMYKRNASIFLTKTELVMVGDLFGQVSRPHLMPEERSVDINNLVDFDLAEFFLNRQTNAK